MNDLNENKKLQQYALDVNDRLPEYCKILVQEFIPFLKGAESSDIESEGRALAELDLERSKLVEAVEKAFQKKEFLDTIFLAESLAIFYERRSYLDEWVEVSTYGLKAAINSGNLLSKAYMLGMLSRVFRIKNMWTEAIDYSKESISIYESLNDEVLSNNNLKISKAEILDTLGNIYRSIGSLKTLEDSEESFSESIKLFNEAGDVRGELKAWDGLAQVYTKQGKLKSAKNLLEKVLKRKKELRDTDFSISITLNNLGKILRDIGIFDIAEATFSEALIKKKELRDWRGEATTYHELGILKYKTGSIVDALSMFNQSLDIKRERGDSHGQGLSLVEIGKLYYESGQIIKTCEYLIKAVANLTKESEQYRQNEIFLTQEVLECVNFRELSDVSINILKKLEMNPLQSQELRELLSLQNIKELNSAQKAKLDKIITIQNLCSLRKSQAIDESARRYVSD